MLYLLFPTISLFCLITLFYLASTLNTPRVFSLKIVNFLNFSLFIFNFAKILTFFSEKLCFFQAYFVLYSQESSILWTMIISYTTKANLIENNNSLYLNESLFLLISFCVPIITSL